MIEVKVSLMSSQATVCIKEALHTLSQIPVTMFSTIRELHRRVFGMQIEAEYMAPQLETDKIPKIFDVLFAHQSSNFFSQREQIHVGHCDTVNWVVLPSTQNAILQRENTDLS